MKDYEGVLQKWTKNLPPFQLINTITSTAQKTRPRPNTCRSLIRHITITTNIILYASTLFANWLLHQQSYFGSSWTCFNEVCFRGSNQRCSILTWMEESGHRQCSTLPFPMPVKLMESVRPLSSLSLQPPGRAPLCRLPAFKLCLIQANNTSMHVLDRQEAAIWTQVTNGDGREKQLYQRRPQTEQGSKMRSPNNMASSIS